MRFRFGQTPFATKAPVAPSACAESIGTAQPPTKPRHLLPWAAKRPAKGEGIQICVSFQNETPPGDRIAKRRRAVAFGKAFRGPGEGEGRFTRKARSVERALFLMDVFGVPYSAPSTSKSASMETGAAPPPTKLPPNCASRRFAAAISTRRSAWVDILRTRALP